MKKNTPEIVTRLLDDEYFVFGSNRGGRHSKGAALIARTQFCAEYGVGKGLTGKTYAIPTKGFKLEVLPLSEIQEYVKEFLEFARNNLDKVFLVTKIGCGLAGYRIGQIAPMFVNSPSNVILPKEFDNYFMSLRYFAGIGSRKTPIELCPTIDKICQYLIKKGYVLRSGGADGADTFFEKAYDKFNGLKEIYVPWHDFNDKFDGIIYSNEDWEIASKFHPSFESLSTPVKRLMARNTAQVLGQDGAPKSEFIICWTEGGQEIGGTAQALRIAKAYDVPVFNLGSEKGLDELRNYVKSVK